MNGKGFIDRSCEGFESRGRCIVREEDLMVRSLTFFPENVCCTVWNSGRSVNSGHSQIRDMCGYGSPAPYINGKSEAASYVIMQPRVSGDKGPTDGQAPQTAKHGPPRTWAWDPEAPTPPAVLGRAVTDSLRSCISSQWLRDTHIHSQINHLTVIADPKSYLSMEPSN
jgi:hypothetical protein